MSLLIESPVPVPLFLTLADPDPYLVKAGKPANLAKIELASASRVPIRMAGFLSSVLTLKRS